MYKDKINVTKMLQKYFIYVIFVKTIDIFRKNYIIYSYVFLRNCVGGYKKMAVAIVNKFLDALGLSNENEQEVENEDVYEFDEGKDEDEETKGGIFGSIGSKKSKIVNMPQVQSVKMVITQPTSFEQSEEICNYLKEKKSIIVNLEYVNKDVARRIIDFLSGAVHALDGYIQKYQIQYF